MLCRPRRLTDRSLPYGLSSISPDANLFDELTEIEKRLDWTIARRRQEINDTLARGTLTVCAHQRRLFRILNTPLDKKEAQNIHVSFGKESGVAKT